MMDWAKNSLEKVEHSRAERMDQSAPSISDDEAQKSYKGIPSGLRWQ